MIPGVLKSTFISIGVASTLQLIFNSIQSDAIYEFLKLNITNLQIALLAINGATLGIVLTKIREILDKCSDKNVFESVKKQMLLSIKEQAGLVVVSLLIIGFMEAKSPPFLIEPAVYKAALLTTFIYTLLVLYDTANSVFVLLDFRIDDV